MKLVAQVVTAVLAGLIGVAAQGQAPTNAGQLQEAMKQARWTGPMLASNAETLPKGHFYTEPYFFDAISAGEHSPGSSGFYQYGLLDGLTVGLQPTFAFGAHPLGKEAALGDFKLLSQVRFTHFTPNHQVPTVSLVLNEVLPTGRDDGLSQSQQGHGSGSFATEVGVNVQYYFLLDNGRLLRARINLLKSFPYGAEVSGRSVYGTDAGFRGHAKPGSKNTLIGAVEYSLSREWVLALDVITEATGQTSVTGTDGSGSLVRKTFPSTWYAGFAPAVEYNWSDRSGALLGVWINPRGHNTPASITPAVAYSRFW